MRPSTMSRPAAPRLSTACCMRRAAADSNRSCSICAIPATPRVIAGASSAMQHLPFANEPHMANAELGDALLRTARDALCRAFNTPGDDSKPRGYHHALDTPGATFVTLRQFG